jgi:ribose transport system ATP-binding protein
LFNVVRTVAGRGTGVVLITHHLAEVFAVSDEVTVLREGRIVLSSPTSGTNMSDLVRAMLGGTSIAAGAQHGIASAASTARAADAEAARPVLEVQNLHVGEKLADVSFDVLPGETVGIVGLAGSGRSTLLRTLYGDIRPTAGRMVLKGARYRPRAPRDAIARRVYLIPEDRRVQGLLLTKPIVENVVLSILGRLVNKLRALRMHRGRIVTREMMSRLDVRARSMDQVVGELSGGNQQKVVLAKALAAGADLLLLDEPTFGVDIGATREIVRHVQTLAERGTAVVWVTSDLLELLEVADRLLVLRDATVEGVIRRGDPDFNQDALIIRMQRTQFRELATA